MVQKGFELLFLKQSIRGYFQHLGDVTKGKGVGETISKNEEDHCNAPHPY